jgi:hypothetical protein
MLIEPSLGLSGAMGGGEVMPGRGPEDTGTQVALRDCMNDNQHTARNLTVAQRTDDDQPARPPCDWEETVAAFFEAVVPDQRAAVERAFTDPRFGGAGLRRWLESIVWLGEAEPRSIPRSVIDVYLHDPAAMPLCACEQCGMPLPVRPNPLEGPDAAPEQVYFTQCPWCGEQAGACEMASHVADTSAG